MLLMVGRPPPAALVGRWMLRGSYTLHNAAYRSAYSSTLIARSHTFIATVWLPAPAFMPTNGVLVGAVIGEVHGEPVRVVTVSLSATHDPLLTPGFTDAPIS